MAGTVHIEPANIDITVEDGETILHAAERLGYHWPTVCHGQAICTTCVFEVVDGSENLNGRVLKWLAGVAQFALPVGNAPQVGKAPFDVITETKASVLNQ